MYKETGSIGRCPGTGGISKVSSLVKELIEEQMQRDDDTSLATAYQLHQMLPSQAFNQKQHLTIAPRFFRLSPQMSS